MSATGLVTLFNLFAGFQKEVVQEEWKTQPIKIQLWPTKRSRPWLANREALKVRKILVPGAPISRIIFCSQVRAPSKAWSHAAHVWVHKVCRSLTESPKHSPFGLLFCIPLHHYRTQNILVFQYCGVSSPLPDVLSAWSRRQGLRLL